MATIKFRKEGKWLEVESPANSPGPIKAAISFDYNSRTRGSSLNFTSITKINTGFYKVSFQTPPPDAGFCGIFTSDKSDRAGRNDVCSIFKTEPGVTSYVRAYTSIHNNSAENSPVMNLFIFY